MRVPITRLPQVTVSLDGQPLDPHGAAALVEICVQQKLSLPDQCELTFSRNGSLDSAVSEVALGRPLVVSTPEGTLFSGEVTALAHEYLPDRGDLVRLRGYSCLHRLQKRQFARTFSNVSLGELARELAGDLPISIAAPEHDRRWGYVPQCGVSDLQLLDERARACGLYFVCRDDELKFVTLEGSGAPVELRLGSNLHRVRLELNGRSSCRRVSSYGWNPGTATVHVGEAQTPRSGRDILAEASPDQVNGRAERGVYGQIVQSDDDATDLAQARLDQHSEEEVSLWGMADGNVALVPASLVCIEDVVTSMAGRYVLTEVLHRISAEEGYVCEFSNLLAPLPPAAAAQPAALARVTSVDDPEHLGRVQVAFLTLQELGSDWLQVLAPGAGAGKGLVMLPTVGDLVIVLCLSDLAHGIVIGGLFGPGGPKDAGIADGQRSRFSFGTAHGHALQFDDVEPRALFRDGAGSTLEFTPGRVRLHAETDLEISAPGKRITISGKSIDFNQA